MVTIKQKQRVSTIENDRLERRRASNRKSAQKSRYREMMMLDKLQRSFLDLNKMNASIRLENKKIKEAILGIKTFPKGTTTATINSSVPTEMQSHSSKFQHGNRGQIDASIREFVMQVFTQNQSKLAPTPTTQTITPSLLYKLKKGPANLYVHGLSDPRFMEKSKHVNHVNNKLPIPSSIAQLRNGLQSRLFNPSANPRCLNAPELSATQDFAKTSTQSLPNIAATPNLALREAHLSSLFENAHISNLMLGHRLQQQQNVSGQGMQQQTLCFDIHVPHQSTLIVEALKIPTSRINLLTVQQAGLIASLLLPDFHSNAPN